MDIYEIILSFALILVSFALSIASRYVRSRVSEASWSNAAAWVDVAVNAAEQVFKGIPESGSEKFEYVFELLKELDISDSEKNMLIEASVKKMNDK